MIDLSGSSALPVLRRPHPPVHDRQHAARRRSYYYTTLNDPTPTGRFRASPTREHAGGGSPRCGTWATRASSPAPACGGGQRGTGDGPTILNPAGSSRLWRKVPAQPEKGEVLASPNLLRRHPDELLKAVRENIHYGARSSSSWWTTNPTSTPREDIKFVIDEAAKSGLKVAAHVWTTAGAHNAALAVFASMEHLNGVADEDLSPQAQRRGRVFTPFRSRCCRASVGRWRAGRSTNSISRIRAGLKAGVTIAFRIDAIHDLPGTTADRRRSPGSTLPDAGLTPRRCCRR